MGQRSRRPSKYIQLDRWEELLKQRRALAEEFSAGTTDEMMAFKP
jgi:hypothetical protein